MYIDEGGYLYLSDMYVKEVYRGQGVGSEVMVQLCAFADEYNMDIRCIPSSDDDGSGDERLILFYKRYGFEVSMNIHTKKKRSISKIKTVESELLC